MFIRLRSQISSTHVYYSMKGFYFVKLKRDAPSAAPTQYCQCLNNTSPYSALLPSFELFPPFIAPSPQFGCEAKSRSALINRKPEPEPFPVSEAPKRKHRCRWNEVATKCAYVIFITFFSAFTEKKKRQ